MIDFSKIFGNGKDKEKPSPPIHFAKEPPKEKPPYKEEAKKISKEEKTSGGIDTKLLYKESLMLVDKIFNSSQPILLEDVKKVKGVVEKIVDCIIRDGEQLLELTFNKLPQEYHFISLNMVNVCILSLYIGVALGFSRDKLIDLGTAALLHDLGMKKYRSIIDQPRRLTPQEYKEIESHPIVTAQMLSHLKELSSKILESISQEHERMDGSGYPKNLKKEELDEFAQIMAVVDVYEALTHSRPYRETYKPSEAVKIMLEMKEKFSYPVMNAFLEKIGIYPKGSYVELNTKEIAQIIRQNPKLPCYPVVKIIYNSKGEKLDEPKEVDLSTNPTVYIKKCL